MVFTQVTSTIIWLTCHSQDDNNYPFGPLPARCRTYLFILLWCWWWWWIDGSALLVEWWNLINYGCLLHCTAHTHTRTTRAYGYGGDDDDDDEHHHKNHNDDSFEEIWHFKWRLWCKGERARAPMGNTRFLRVLPNAYPKIVEPNRSTMPERTFSNGIYCGNRTRIVWKKRYFNIVLALNSPHSHTHARTTVCAAHRNDDDGRSTTMDEWS